jgi:flagellar biosynthesis GTPase FlhF
MSLDKVISYPWESFLLTCVSELPLGVDLIANRIVPISAFVVGLTFLLAFNENVRKVFLLCLEIAGTWIWFPTATAEEYVKQLQAKLDSMQDDKRAKVEEKRKEKEANAKRKSKEKETKVERKRKERDAKKHSTERQEEEAADTLRMERQDASGQQQQTPPGTSPQAVTGSSGILGVRIERQPLTDEEQAAHPPAMG